MQENINDPTISSEERKNRISRAAAVRNQAAAFRPLVQQVRKQTAKIADLEAELEQYRKTEPGAGDGEPGTTNGDMPTGGMMAAKISELQKRSQGGNPVFH